MLNIRKIFTSEMIIGITGSIGSGKTTVAKLFSRHHFNRIDADEIGHKLMQKNLPIRKKLTNFFDNEILDRNNDVDRKKLGDIVFSNGDKLIKLNSIMHPLIIREIKAQINEIKNKCGSLAKIIIDAPLLLETNAKSLVDKIIVVKCDERKIFDRLSKKFSKEKIENILKSQMPLKEKLKHADFIIDNNESEYHLSKQVKDILKNFLYFL